MYVLGVRERRRRSRRKLLGMDPKRLGERKDLNLYLMCIKINCCTCVQSFQILSSLAWILWVFWLLSWLPTVAAQPPLPSKSFPNPTFQAFSNFILSNFHSEISLTTTLLVLFSLINNPELLNLHARQTHPAFPDENISKASGCVTLSNIDYGNSRYNKRYLKVRTVQGRIASILENELKNIQVEM